MPVQTYQGRLLITQPDLYTASAEADRDPPGQEMHLLDNLDEERDTKLLTEIGTSRDKRYQDSHFLKLLQAVKARDEPLDTESRSWLDNMLDTILDAQGKKEAPQLSDIRKELSKLRDEFAKMHNSEHSTISFTTEQLDDIPPSLTLSHSESDSQDKKLVTLEFGAHAVFRMPRMPKSESSPIFPTRNGLPTQPISAGR